MMLLIAGTMFFAALTLPTLIAAALGDQTKELPMRERGCCLLGACGLSWIAVGLIVSFGWSYFGGILGVATTFGLVFALALLIGFRSVTSIQ